MPSAKLIDLLGTKYDLDPLFFYQMMSNREREFSRRYAIPYTTRKGGTSPRYKFMSQIEQTCLFLGFDEEGSRRVSPRLWTIVKTGCPNSDQNVVILFQLPEISSQMNSWAYSNNISTLDTYSPRSTPRIAKEVFTHAVETVQQLSTRRIQDANRHPLDFLLPFLESLELHFVQEMTSINTRLREQDEDTWRSPAQADDFVRTAWVAARSAIEDFQIICDRIGDYSENLSSNISGDFKPSKEMTYFLQRCKKGLARARLSEAHIRDTVQINVGALSLEESRKSVQQADSVGRLTILGFVFLPLSLVTSFYGMNINEITGSGASWKAFLISTLILCYTILLVCSFVFRDMERVKFISRAPIIPFLYAILFILALVLSYGRPSSWSASRAIEHFIEDWGTARGGLTKGKK